MKKTQWIWFDGEVVAWEKATTHVLSHTLHYGGGAFEGIRFYQTEDGPAIFRLKEHVERLFYSCNVIGLKIKYSPDELATAIKDIVRENKLQQGYIRPLVFWGEGDLRIVSEGLPVHTVIACWSLGNYLSADCVDVKVSDFIRIHPGSTVTDAKLCGHYVNSIIASLAIKNTHYHESLLLDYKGNIAEGPGENFFCVIDKEIFTPSLGNILPGITRSMIMAIARDLGFKCHESSLSLDDVFKAQEALFTGTAVEVTPIRSLNDSIFGDGRVGPITQLIHDAYFDVIQGNSNKYRHYLSFIE